MEQEKIRTLHPQGKQGVNISRYKYDQIKSFILDTIQSNNEITFEKLTDLAIAELTDKFEGKVIWYLTTIKLDLEARKLIERVPKTSPQKLKLVAAQ
ncbi:MAG: hypothetical protein JNJ57_17655 [Saprospiraceae bacterium]|nr:hypothetical protein [Saprospiraceae bacterium]